MSWFKRRVTEGRWDRSNAGDPGRPARHVRVTDQVRPEDNLDRYREAPRIHGRFSCGKTRDEAAAAMRGRGTVAAEEEKFDHEHRAGPGRLTNYTSGAPRTARDRHDTE